MTVSAQRRDDKLRVFARYWAQKSKPEVICIRMALKGYRVSLAWVKIKVARMRHF